MSDALAEHLPVVVAVRRTAFGKISGMHKELRADELLAPVLTALAEQVPEMSLNDVLIGNAVGAGGNLARLAALRAGLGVSIPGVTVDRQCGSGLEAVSQACRLIQAGAGQAFLAGGVESISTAPGRAYPAVDGSWKFFARARFSPDEYGDPSMGEAAENVARHFSISRSRQDAFAERSHQRAVQANANGRFAAEILGLAADECPRRTMSAKLLARFGPAFVPGGTVTAGNSCQDADGAAAVLVLSKSYAMRCGFTEGLTFLTSAVAGVDPQLPGIGAAAAIEAMGGVQLAQRIEITEAFAAQVLACADMLGVADSTLNLEGGALAFGHPYGASGTLLIMRLFSQLRELSQATTLAAQAEGSITEGIAAISIAGGMGLASRWRWEQF